MSIATSRRLIAALLVAQLVLAALIFRNWAYVTTYRLYLDSRVDGVQSSAVQQFDVEASHVVPRIVTRAAERIVFASHVGQDAVVRADIQSASRVWYFISWHQGIEAHTIAAGTVEGSTSIAGAFPTGNGTIELASDGPVTWVDPRIVRSLREGRHMALMALLLTGSFILHGRVRTANAVRAWSRRVYFTVGTVVTSLAVSCVAVESALRAAGDHIPSGVASERHDLGEVTRDPRWEDSPRYERRLRARVDTLNEWRYGDIVRMGFIPPSVAPAELHRFRFVTDAEGFRNPTAREHFDIAALGDSFTDAMTMGVEESWPAQLERRLHVAVQNYGTAGFGPQQELLALRDYVARHRPSHVVLAFFAGNDLFDAEAFDRFERSGTRASPLVPGWRLKDVFSRADTWFVVSAMNVGIAWLQRAQLPPLAAAGTWPSNGAVSPASGAQAFDRGMFTVFVGGRLLKFAFMPPYLNTLNFSASELRERLGWSLTRAAIRDMRRVTHDFGGELTVMFLPFKNQVYWPMVERVLSRDELATAIQFYLAGNQRPVDLDAMSRNRLAQNHILRELCEQEQIPFLDVTEALQSRFEAGENVYFPDESHLNEIGEAVVADTLATFLRQRTNGGIDAVPSDRMNTAALLVTPEQHTVATAGRSIGE